MTVTSLTVKSQVTVPKAIRESLGIGPGSQVLFVREGKRAYIVPKPKTRRQQRAEIEARLRSAAGLFKSGMSTDELMRLTRGED